MNTLCKGTPHTRHEVIRKVDVPDKPLLIHEVGTCSKCGTQRHYERVIDEGSFVGSLESNPIISHYSGYDRSGV